MKDHEHFDFDGWRRLVEELMSGKIRRWLEVIACSTCRRRLLHLVSLQGSEPSRSGAIRGAWRERFRAELRKASAESDRAASVIEKFLGASELQRQIWIDNSSLRGNLQLCRQVLQEAHMQATHDPERAWELSLLVSELAGRVEGEPLHRARLWNDCLAGGQLVSARVHLRLGQLDDAEKALRATRRYQDLGTADPLAEATRLEVDSAVSVRRAQFAMAARKLQGARERYRSVGDRQGEGRCLQGIAYQNLVAGRPAQALWHVLKTRQFLGEDMVERQDLFLRHNEVASLCFLHEFSRADALLEKSRSLYERFPDSQIQLRRPWIRGKIALGFSRLDEGKTNYEATRRLAMDTWGAYETSILALEFGQLYLELGHRQEAQRLLEQAIPVLEARSLPQISKAEELLETARQDARS